jgi:hypothetical protein
MANFMPAGCSTRWSPSGRSCRPSRHTSSLFCESKSAVEAGLDADLPGSAARLAGRSAACRSDRRSRPASGTPRVGNAAADDESFSQVLVAGEGRLRRRRRRHVGEQGPRHHEGAGVGNCAGGLSDGCARAIDALARIAAAADAPMLRRVLACRRNRRCQRTQDCCATRGVGLCAAAKHSGCTARDYLVQRHDDGTVGRMLQAQGAWRRMNPHDRKAAARLRSDDVGRRADRRQPRARRSLRDEPCVPVADLRKSEFELLRFFSMTYVDPSGSFRIVSRWSRTAARARTSAGP